MYEGLASVALAQPRQRTMVGSFGLGSAAVSQQQVRGLRTGHRTAHSGLAPQLVGLELLSAAERMLAAELELSPHQYL